MPTRTESVFASYPQLNWKWIGASTTQSPEIIQSQIRTSVGQKVDVFVKLANHEELIKLRQNATTPRTLVVDKMEIKSAAWWLRCYQGNLASGKLAKECRGGTTTMSFIGVPTPAMPSSNVRTRVASKASTKFNSAIRETVQTFNGPVFLGELKETLEMLNSPLKGIYNLSQKVMREAERRVRRIPRRRSRRRKEVLITQYMQDAWLSWNLGVKPFISDVEAIADTLEKFGKIVQLPVQASASELSSVSSGFNTELLGYRQWDLQTKTRVSLRGAISAEVIMPASPLARLQQAVGMDWNGAIRDFAPTVWNCLPMSFVADYFSNIGSCIEADLGYIPKCTFVSSTERIDQIRKQRVIQYEPSSATTWLYTPEVIFDLNSHGEAVFTKSTLVRTTQQPPVLFYWKLPKAKQAVTIAGLLKLASRLEGLINKTLG